MTHSTITSAPTRCQLCQHKPLLEFVVPDQTRLWRCEACGLYQYGQLVDAAAYQAEYHHGYDRHRASKLRTAMIRLNRVSKFVTAQRPRLLDVGASVGCTIEAGGMLGWNSAGVDISPEMIAYCRQRNLDCHEASADALPFDDETFDVVTSWHVIEHVEDVQATLREWRRVLKPGGLLVLETPDANCLKVQILGPRYRKFWPPEHTYTFSRRTLSEFVRRCDFDLLTPPPVGRLGDFSAGMATYAVGYQFYHALRRSLGIEKAFQLFARKPQVRRGSAAA